MFFRDWAFGIGPVMIRGRIPISVKENSMEAPHQIRTMTSKALLLQPEVLLFRPRLGLPRIATPFPIKATVTLGLQSSDVEGRIPLFSSIFTASWMLGWTAAGVLILRAEGARPAALVVVAGWMLAIVGFCASWMIESRRFRRGVEELEDEFHRQGR